MKRQPARKKGKLAYILIPVLLYLFAFSPSLTSELYFKPVWALDVERDAAASTDQSSMAIAREAETLIPFRMGDLFGYAEPDGLVRYRDKTRYGVLLGENAFINYANVSENLVIRKTDGSILSSIVTTGYPVSIEDDALLVVDTSRTSLTEIDFTGTVVWRRDWPILITGIAGNGGLLFVGRADGYADLLDRNGDLTFQWNTEGTRIAVVYAVAVSDTGDYLAVIAGIEPQKMALLQRKDDVYRPVALQVLKSNFRRSMNLSFSRDEKYLFFEDEGLLRRYNIETKEIIDLPAGGRSLHVEQDETSGLFYHLYSVPGNRALQVFDEGGYILTQTLTPETSVMNVKPGSLYLGRDGMFMRIDVRRN